MMHGFFGNIGGFGWVGMILSLVVTLILIVAVTVLIVYAIRGLRRRSNQPLPQGPAPTPNPTPKEILQARYARGEITREQYLVMLEDIK
jgi:putative membrane protein